MPRRRPLARPGTAFLVGAGPGDLQLLTLRARAVIAEADVLVYDFLANERLLAWAPRARAICVGKRGGRHTMAQEAINQLLIREVRKGQRVVRLKGGDPFLFGRGGEEGRALAEAGLAFEVVPGVTSAIAVPAYAGIPLTERTTSASVAIVTGHEHTGKGRSAVDYRALAKFGTVVFLMGMKKIELNLRNLRAAGMPSATPAAAIQWGTGPDQRTVAATLGTLAKKVAEEGLGAPGIIVVGEVVSLRDELNWYESRPWFGKRIVTTRSRDAAPEFIDEIERRGASVVETPSIAFAEPDEPLILDRAIGRLAAYDWVVFTSANGVDYFWRRLRALGFDARALGLAKIAVVGPATARALERYGLFADVWPDKFQSSKLLAALGGAGRIKGKRILFVRAQEGNDEFLKACRGAGADIELTPAYKTLAARRPKGFRPTKLDGEPADLYVFASPSAVKSFQAMLRPAERRALRGAPAACIGPVTAEAAEQAGYSPTVVPEHNTLEGLVEAMELYFGEQDHEAD